FSALRAGLRPWCADLFADADLTSCCPSIRLPWSAYPHGFQRLIDRELSGPWLYTGGLENWFQLVEAMARARPLWGNRARSLFPARDAKKLARAARTAGLPAPRVSKYAEWLISPQLRWLVKPVFGSGGKGIHFYRAGRPRTLREAFRLLRGDRYLQEFIP